MGGRKSVRHFSYPEFDCVKHKFHRHKILWDLRSGLSRQGDTSDSKIDAIYNVYMDRKQVLQKILN